MSKRMAELDNIIERQDGDDHLGSKWLNNRCFFSNTTLKCGEVSYKITNTTECLSAEDGVRERRYSTIILSPLAIVPLMDVLWRLMESGQLERDVDKHIYALEHNTKAFNDKLNEEGEK